jgi:xanthine dehydrogenase accessory factor
MDTVDQEVLKQLASWISEDKNCYLATIVRTFSSAPRPVGSLMALTTDGQQVGSLSGGCVEEELFRNIRELDKKVPPTTYSFGISSEESARLGLPCGGQMEVLVEQITNTELSNYKKHIDDILSNIQKHQCIRRNVSLPEGKISLIASTPEQRLTSCIVLSANSFGHVLGPAFKLIIIGANQVSQYLAEFAIALNYRVMICDPRPEAVKSLNLCNVEIFQKMPDDFILDQEPDKQCAIVTVTHDPKIDDLALIEALASDAFYVGAMGSKRTSKARYDRLLNMSLVDLTTQQLDALYAPVGLSIGSKTPPEIALSIMAQLTRLRRDFGVIFN